MATEIARCPFCEGECSKEDGPMGAYHLACTDCCYQSSAWETSEAKAIAAHNALAQDVTLARSIRAALGPGRRMVLRQPTIGSVFVTAHDFEHRLPRNEICGTGPALDAALAQLAEKLDGGA